MLIWRGWGIWGLVLPVFIAMLINESAGEVFGVQNYAKVHPWAYPIMMMPGATAVWFLGKWRERRDAPQSVLNLETNETVQLVKKNDLFWIPLKYWGLVCMAVGVYMAISKPPQAAEPRASQQTDEQRLQTEQKRSEALLSDMNIHPTALDESDPKNIALVQVDKQSGEAITVQYYGFSQSLTRAQMQALLGKESKAACQHLWMPSGNRIVFERCRSKS